MSKAKPEKRPLPKRFYREVAVENGCILLDGRPLRTPAKRDFLVPQQALAEAIAAEWQAQQNEIDPDRMPLTRLHNIATDRAAIDREAWLDDMVRYGETDLLCYRAEGELGRRQAEQFDPILAWVRAQHGIVLRVTEGIMPVAQSPESLAILRSMFAAASDGELAALAMLVPLLGSAVLALALWRGRISVEEALYAARLDEDFQAEQWGEDEEAAAAWEGKRRDIVAAAFFLDRQAIKNTP